MVEVLRKARRSKNTEGDCFLVSLQPTEERTDLQTGFGLKFDMQVRDLMEISRTTAVSSQN